MERRLPAERGSGVAAGPPRPSPPAPSRGVAEDLLTLAKDRMRLFVAVNLPADVRRKVEEAVAVVRDRGMPARWTDASQYHVTLKFIGRVRPDRRDAHAEVLRRIGSGYRPVDVTVGELGAFPSLRRPRVIWMGVEATPQLRALKHDLEHGYASLGVDRETRAFRPHVTLARAEEDAAAGAFRELEDLAGRVELEESFTARHLDLMRSRLRPEGPAYAVEERIDLEGGRG